MKDRPRVITWRWLALQKGILTIDNLHPQKKMLVNACPMCMAGEETEDLLLLNCKAVQALWSSLFSFQLVWM